jgi:hypothetical protein
VQRIPDKSVNAAVRGEFVELIDFLPTTRVWDGTGDTLTIEDGKVTVAPKKRQTLTSYELWQEAFTVYEYVVVSSHPGKFAEFSSYRQIMQRASKQFHWPALCTFDAYHRIAVAGTPGRRLDEVDASLYAQILNSTAVKANMGCYNCKATDHL